MERAYSRYKVGHHVSKFSGRAETTAFRIELMYRFPNSFLTLRVLILHLFFFQAEDGIRDGTVTGVQTCALPICRRAARPSAGTTHSRSARCLAHPGRAHAPATGGHGPGRGGARGAGPAAGGPVPARSEERRVGKECRSRWSPYR